MSSPIRKRGGSPLRKVSYVHQSVTEEDAKQIDDAFRLFDYEGNGYLHYREIKAAMRALGLNVKKANVMQRMKEHGAQVDDPIDAETFRAILQDELSRRDPSERLRRAFELMDVDGTGKIHWRGLKRLCNEIGHPIDDAELRDMIDEFDADADGFVNWDDFEKIAATEGDSD